RELYDKPNIVMITHERLNNIKQRYDANSQFGELIIANYDVYERKNEEPVQMDLFQLTQKMKESQQDENY
ncbi:MAG: DNA adenine methylase, partial [Eubacteriales bacterium]